jgi:hypothetical protein
MRHWISQRVTAQWAVTKKPNTERAEDRVHNCCACRGDGGRHILHIRMGTGVKGGGAAHPRTGGGCMVPTRV